ncbi:hypothetical protein KGD82_02105 [Nocardiopsis eucommiae]|uniref:Uncharacterized protein n=1 Tax=Nocardiopsis eucommiae TaxID=2831970 RepID=A0A975LAR5_9ACTN|nr:hypothetical protein KGD82_02105 [Nocardiopsis eucommiae]
MFVSVIALCALVIAYNGIYRFALIVHHEGGFLPHVFPLTFALLVLMAFWVSYVLRAAPPSERLWVDVVLIPLLILAAAVPMVLHSMDMVDRIAANHEGIVQVVVAVAPLAALLVAFLLWITVRAHVRRRNSRGRPRANPADDRATVLRPRPGPEDAPPRDERGTETLKTRLLRLGSDDEDEDPANGPEDASRTAPLPARVSTLRRDREEREEKELLEREDREREDRERAEQEERERESGATVEVGSVGLSEDGGVRSDADDADSATEPITTVEAGHEEPGEASVPTLPLPRRARDGDNPIRRAAAEPPVVPAPTLSPESESDADAKAESGHDVGHGAANSADLVTDSDRLADEGFEHDSPVADPSTDEAEAPVPAPVVPEPERTPQPEQRPDPEPAVAGPGTGEGTGSEAGEPGRTVGETVPWSCGPRARPGPAPCPRSRICPPWRRRWRERSPGPWTTTEGRPSGNRLPSTRPPLPWPTTCPRCGPLPRTTPRPRPLPWWDGRPVGPRGRPRHWTTTPAPRCGPPSGWVRCRPVPPGPSRSRCPSPSRCRTTNRSRRPSRSTTPSPRPSRWLGRSPSANP